MTVNLLPSVIASIRSAVTSSTTLANVLLNNYKIQDNKKLDDDYYKKVVRVLLVNLNWYPG